jgi:superfamily II DNA or RNA helicase
VAVPRVFDNIENMLLPALRETLAVAERADFCVGYFNLRGWKQIDDQIERWSGDSGKCRVLVGMQRLPKEELELALRLSTPHYSVDNASALKIRKKLAEEFRQQLLIGVPTDEDERGLRRLSSQLKAGKVVVKLFLRHPLHAKLYMLFRSDKVNPKVGYLGSSNLTFSGLIGQGELNVDIMDHDACDKLAKWFEARWGDRLCLDISQELSEIIDESWAREEMIPPYHVYLKIAYHLSREARAGLSEFRLPRDFPQRLFPFQEAAVKIAAHHLNKRDGVMIGDVVGLGKTIMATALLRICEEQNLNALIICPKNLVKMWEDYRERFGLRWAKVISISRVLEELPDLRRFRLVLIDESHNLRNREGKRYRAIEEYIRANDSKCVLLSATPYNKTYLDLSNQLRLFLPEDRDIGIRPEKLLRDIGELEFARRQCAPRSLAAFEHSPYADDWRELMRLYLVRRTRSFIQTNYADTDTTNGRKYLTFQDGTRSYFPVRQPRTVTFPVRSATGDDQYAALFDDDVVTIIRNLHLPRYGLGNYVHSRPNSPPTTNETKILQDLSRAGKRLQGFCRTGLFKRLESSGVAFLESVERHILRNFVFAYALTHGLPLPIGAQDAASLASGTFDVDPDDIGGQTIESENGSEGEMLALRRAGRRPLRTIDEYMTRASEIYHVYEKQYHKRFRWLPSTFFGNSLLRDLRADAEALQSIISRCGDWNPVKDEKLNALHLLLTKIHPTSKVLIFSQFADTVEYLVPQLRARGVTALAGATGNTEDPTVLAWRFSPDSNDKRPRVTPETEIRVLIATDVLSEGQNLQDAHIVVNFDLPWALVRLIQRAGRVDRIGQKATEILCYSFLPADGIERIIRLRSRVRQRLFENAEVVGTDEVFFEDDGTDGSLIDLYHEKSGILDGDDDGEVDLASYAFQIWKNATENNPEVAKQVTDLPDVVYSSKTKSFPYKDLPEGVLVYMRTAEDNDALAYVDKGGNSITESQYEILRLAECGPETHALGRNPLHHTLVQKGAEHIVREEKTTGGQLGRPSGARFRTYERLKRYAEEVNGTLFATDDLKRVIDNIFHQPLRSTAVDILNRQMKSGVDDRALFGLCVALREEDRLTVTEAEAEQREPRVICSLGNWDGEH